MLIKCDNGYKYWLEFDGTRYVATDTRRGYKKRRMCAHVWENDYGQRMTNLDVVACLEQGVRDYQSQHTETPRHVRRGGRPPVAVELRHLSAYARRNPRGEGNRYE